MPLKLMYITNRVDIAKMAERAGVDRIFIDMEYIGKSNRQGGMNTVQNHHTLEDIKKISQSLEKAELLVRINPIHESTQEYIASEEEIDKTIKNGADIIMLPYFKTVEEVNKFIKYVDGRAKTMLLVETPESVNVIDDILQIQGIDELFIGLNDLSLGYKKKFMFELLTDGTVENLCYKFKKAKIPYGFGGIASIGKGSLPAEKIITEHYRLESTRVILSRSFCNIKEMESVEIYENIFLEGIEEIRSFENIVATYRDFFANNKREVREIVNLIIAKQ